MPTHPSGRRREALRQLGLQDPVQHTEVVTAYRRLARQHHPDLGGDPEVFAALTAARELLLADVHRAPDVGAGSRSARPVTVRQRRGRRIVRSLRRRLGRKGEPPRHLE